MHFLNRKECVLPLLIHNTKIPCMSMKREHGALGHTKKSMFHVHHQKKPTLLFYDSRSPNTLEICQNLKTWSEILEAYINLSSVRPCLLFLLGGGGAVLLRACSQRLLRFVWQCICSSAIRGSSQCTNVPYRHSLDCFLRMEPAWDLLGESSDEAPDMVAAIPSPKRMRVAPTEEPKVQACPELHKTESSTSWVQRLEDVCAQQLSRVRQSAWTLETVCSGLGTPAFAMKVCLGMTSRQNKTRCEEFLPHVLCHYLALR